MKQLVLHLVVVIYIYSSIYQKNSYDPCPLKFNYASSKKKILGNIMNPFSINYVLDIFQHKKISKYIDNNMNPLRINWMVLVDLKHIQI